MPGNKTEYRFRFKYGEFQDEAELSIVLPAFWNGQVPPAIFLKAFPGKWRRFKRPAPITILTRQMLLRAQEESGLNFKFRAQPWHSEVPGSDTLIRELVLVGDNSARLQQLFPAFALS